MPKAVQGHATFSDFESGKPLLEIDTVACAHCGGHFPSPQFEATAEARKSRAGRGYCRTCDGYVCGKGCAACVPVLQYLENLEAGRPADHKPVRVYTGE